MIILSREEMKNTDQYTMTEFGLSSAILMENAGRNCVEAMLEEIGDEEKFAVIFCGHGNNGGDGFVIARWLHVMGHDPVIVFLGNEERMSPETATNFSLCKKLDIPVIGLEELDLDEYDIIVDAIFGIGFKGEVSQQYRDVIELINQSCMPIYSVDIPSGIDANTGIGKTAVIATHTLTMAAPKYGHFLMDGARCTGTLHVINIGIPHEFYFIHHPKAFILNLPALPPRTKFSHKGDYGKVAIFAGSPGLSGAAVLASRAALRSGAGLIKLYHTPGMETVYETKLTEVMTQPRPYLESGALDHKAMMRILNDSDVCLVGPGLGTDDKAVELMDFLLGNCELPLVIDADGINCIARSEVLQAKLLECPQPLLTPHVGEFARLLGVEADEIEQDMIAALEALFEKYQCPVLLKSNVSILYDGEEFLFNITGNDGLATGGSGDVLAGIITSFIAQGLDLPQAAHSGSWLLGFTADELARTRGKASIIPSDIIDHLFDFSYFDETEEE